MSNHAVTLRMITNEFVSITTRRYMGMILTISYKHLTHNNIIQQETLYNIFVNQLLPVVYYKLSTHLLSKANLKENNVSFFPVNKWMEDQFK